MSEPEVQDSRVHEDRLALQWAHAYADGTLEVVLDALYSHEINVGMQSFWDGGWDVWFGSGQGWNDLRAQENFDRESLAKIAPWLLKTAEDLYPLLKQSRYRMSRGVMQENDFTNGTLIVEI